MKRIFDALVAPYQGSNPLLWDLLLEKTVNLTALENSEHNVRIAEFAMRKSRTTLNVSQMNAVGSILVDSQISGNAAKSVVKLIHGPPGTGKTATIINSIKRILGKLTLIFLI